MYIELSSFRQKLGAGVLLVATVAAYLLLIFRNYAAYYEGEQLDAAHLRRATELAPGNALYWNRLGRLLAFAQQEFGPSLPALQMAVRLSPYSAPYWIDLAVAYQFSGQTSEQLHALEQALELDPRNPELSWQAANYYLVLGRPERGLQLMRLGVESSPQLLPRALDLALKVTNNDVPRVLAELLPQDAGVHLVAVNHLLASGMPEAADQAWARLIALHTPFPFRDAQPYLASLYHRQQSAALRQAWLDVIALTPGLRGYEARNGNLVVNGGFERPVTNFGLDWHYTPRPGAHVQTDNTVLHSGTSSLLISFTGERVTETGIEQWVPMEGGVCYEFSGYMKTSGMEGAGGARLLVRDLALQRDYFVSEDPIGTHAWQAYHGAFRTDPQTRFVTISVGRTATTLVRGDLWVDDLALVKSTGCAQ